MVIKEEKVAGIIAEYNPLHAGHEYHINETKRLTGASYVIVLMSGDFVQRGTPAIIDKYIRAEAAAKAGADIVLELPVRYATASAELFAYGGVSILNSLGIVDYISFGAETDNAESFGIIADILVNEPEKYKSLLKEELKKGNSFPKAREIALGGIVGEESASLMSSPNNILAVEYLKALKKLDSVIEPVFIKRSGDYHDTSLSETSFSSATALRKALLSDSDHANLRHDLTDYMYSHVQSKSFNPVTEDDLSDILIYRLLNITKEELSSIADIDDNLADRILSFVHSPYTFSALSQKLDTKNYTKTRIDRALLHIVLGIKENNDNADFIYAKPLAMKKNSTHLLRSIQDNSSLPIISKTADAMNEGSDELINALTLDINSSEIYNQLVLSKYGKKLKSDYFRSPIII